MSTQNNDTSAQQGYFVNAENAAEMARLTKQAHILSEHLGLFPTTLDLSSTQDILDIACGPGEWAMETARLFPDKQITGIDISNIMINYAKYTAQSLNIANAHFTISDATQQLPFPDASFDMINTRLISGFMRTTIWLPLLEECIRVLRPGGIFCSCESDSVGSTNSPSLARYAVLIAQFMRKNGQYFNAEGEQSGVAAVLPRLLVKAGFQNVQQEAYIVNSSAGQPAHQSSYDDFKTFLKLLQPALVHANLVSQQDIDTLYTQTLDEFADDEFCAVTFFQRTWGKKTLPSTSR